MKIKQFTAVDVQAVLPKVNQLGYSFTVESLATVIKTVAGRLQSEFSVVNNNHIKKLHDVTEYMSQYKDALETSQQNVFKYVSKHPKSTDEFTAELFVALLLIDSAGYKHARIKLAHQPLFDARVLYIAGVIYPVLTGLDDGDMLQLRRTLSGGLPTLEQIEDYLRMKGLQRMIINFVTTFNAFTLDAYVKNVEEFLRFISEIPETEQDEFFELLATYSEYRDHTNEPSNIITQLASLKASEFTDTIVQKFVGYIFHLETMRLHDKSRLILQERQTEENNDAAIKTLSSEYNNRLKQVPSDHSVLQFILDSNR